MNQNGEFTRTLLKASGIIVALLLVAIYGSVRWTPEAPWSGAIELGDPDPPPLPEGTPDLTIARVVEHVRYSVAYLEIESAGGERRGRGSGVVIHPAGYVLTNWHVVRGAARLRVRLEDGESYRGELVSHDRRNDLAVVKIDDPGGFRAAPLGDSDALDVGEWVLAIGAPFGLTSTVSAGIVSAVDRRAGGALGEGTFIQTDAAIHPGNSGGPLVNLRGRVVGINTAIGVDPETERDEARFAGVGFAIPINRARRIAIRLIRMGGEEPTIASASEARDRGFGSSTTRPGSGERGQVPVEG